MSDGQQPEKQQSQQKTGNNNSLITVLIGLLVVGGGIYAYSWYSSPEQIVSRYISSVESGSPDESLLGYKSRDTDGNPVGGKIDDEALVPYVVLGHEIRTTREVSSIGNFYEIRAVVDFQNQAGGIINRVVEFTVFEGKITRIEQRGEDR